MKLFKVLKLPFQIIGFNLYRKFKTPFVKPISIALFLTYSCNSRCKTCKIWKQIPNNELSLSEWKKILRQIGKTPLWVTITGGEPFLRNDLDSIIYYICKKNKPLFINIASNGLLTSKIIEKIKAILPICKKYDVKLTINISIDELFDKYDFIRGTKDGFRKILLTIKYLKKIQTKFEKNLTIGTNITISKFNVDRFYEIYDFIKTNINPDSIIAEIATNRNAFFLDKTISVSPNLMKYLDILSFLKLEETNNPKNQTAKFINSFRKNYYKDMKKYFKNQKTMSCFAGISSVEILPDGNVINCCVKSWKMGNLRENSYSLSRVLQSKEAKDIKNKIKKTNCSCSLSNPYYTNKLTNLFKQG